MEISCSITKRNIQFDQMVYVQFMVPYKNRVIGDPCDCEPAYLLDEGILDFVPFGPAIRCKYVGDANVIPCQDQKTLDRIVAFQYLFGNLPIEQVLEYVWDKYNSNTNGLAEWQIKLLDNLSVAYVHAAVYEELASEDFSATEGVMAPDSYERKILRKLLERTVMGALNRTKNILVRKGATMEVDMLKEFVYEDACSTCCILNKVDAALAEIYFDRLFDICHMGLMEWYEETIAVLYHLNRLCVDWKPSYRASQKPNYKGWKRLTKSLGKLK